MPVPSDTTGADRTLLRHTIYERLCETIVDGTLAPGERLSDAELIRWLGASRTPIREALARLEHDGLVENAPNRYTRVAPLPPDEADLFPIVGALHALAAEAAATVAADLTRMREQAERYDWAVWRSEVSEALAADAALHGLVITASGNEHLGPLVERLLPRLDRAQRKSWSSLEARATSSWHERLIGALAARDAAAAAEASRGEWLELAAVVGRALAQAERRSSVVISVR